MYNKQKLVLKTLILVLITTLSCSKDDNGNKEELESLRKQLTELQQEKNQLTQLHAELQTQLADLNQQNQELATSNDELNHSTSSLTASLTSTTASLTSTTASLTSTTASLTSTTASLTSTTASLTKVTAQNISLLNENEILSSIADLILDNDSIRQDNQSLIEEIEAMIYQLQQLQNGIENGVYKVIDLRREFIPDELGTPESIHHLFKNWIGEDQIHTGSPSQDIKATYVEIRDSTVVKHAWQKVYGHHNADGSSFLNLKISNNWYYGNKGLNKGLYDREFYSIKQIARDTLLLTDKGLGLLYGNEELTGRGTYRYFYEHIKLKKVNSYPEDRLTDEELIALFRKSGKGYYQDELYATLNSLDLMDYVRVFIEDGARHGLDLNHILNKDPDFKIITYEECLDIRNSNTCPPAYAYNNCDPEQITIRYTDRAWENYDILQPTSAENLVLIFHELGHTVFGYNHPFNEDGSVAEGFNNYTDIMGYQLFNPLYDRVNFNNEGGVNRIHFIDQIKRFFAGTDHKYLEECNNGKSNKTFYCNVLGKSFLLE